MIGQQLQGHDMQQGRQRAVVLRQMQHVNAIRFLHLAVGIGKDVQFAAARAHFLKIGLELLDQCVVGSHGDHRHLPVDEGQGSVLQLAGRIGLGVDVGDLLELQRAFHGDRVMTATPEEERVLLHRELSGPFADLGFEFEDLGHGQRQVTHGMQFGRLGLLVETTTHLGENQGQQIQRGELRGEGLGRRDADFRPGAGNEAQGVLAHQRRLGNVADTQRPRHAERLGMLQCRERVGCFARLGNRHYQCLRVGHRITIAIFAGHLDRARDSGKRFEPVAGNQARVVTGSAGDDQDLPNLPERRLAFGTEQAGLDAPGSAKHLERVGQGHRLLEDLLLHVVPVVAQFDSVGRELRLGLGTLDRHSVNPGDAIAVALQLGAIAVLEIDHSPRHLQQGGRVGGGVAPVFGHPEQQGRAFTRHDHARRIGFAKHGNGIGALQLGDRLTHGGQEVGRGLEFMGDQVGDDLGVGIRSEVVTQRLEAPAQRLVILDDAVVHHRQSLGDVRVGIALAGHAMRRPACMRDAAVARRLR